MNSQIHFKEIPEKPVYFIADIAANHDGDLSRALSLCQLAKSSGADAVKFQHHDVSKYVSDKGFKDLGGKFSHQTKWKKSIFEVYKDAEVPKEWTPLIKTFCDSINIDFLSTPYDLDAVDHLNKYVSSVKIGSGDLNWDDMLIKCAKTGKKVLLATGASDIGEVQRAVQLLKDNRIIGTKAFHTKADIVLMQCNTNYTGSTDNFNYINLNVLNTYKTLFPDVILGLSDHTPGHVTTLGAVALGARVIEKHFTDDTKREGPDHPFSMDPRTWSAMVEDTRLLESSLGEPTKTVQENEEETLVLQRRAIRTTADIKKGEALTDLQLQRPSPENATNINRLKDVIGKTSNRDISKGDFITDKDFL